MTIRFPLVLAPVVLLLLAGCAHGGKTDVRPFSPEKPVFSFSDISLPREVEDRVLSLDPGALSERDVDLLSRCPAPRIIAINGSIPVVTMDSFSRFLIAMGYPEERVRDPRNGDYSYSSRMDSKRLAGMIAWYYEKEGMMPILIGHSQGGMLSIKVLHELSGAFNKTIPVWDPFRDEPEKRHFVKDPLTGEDRPVVGLRMGFASAVATGALMRLILGQWDMLTRLRKIPDSVEEFTGFRIKFDLLGSGFFGEAVYRAIGSAAVRNISLPSSYSHMTVPLTEELAMDRESREWINSFVPSTEEPEIADDFRGRRDNILFAADVWYSIKKHWCMELQRLIRARREMNDKQLSVDNDR